MWYWSQIWYFVLRVQVRWVRSTITGVLMISPHLGGHIGPHKVMLVFYPVTFDVCVCNRIFVWFKRGKWAQNTHNCAEKAKIKMIPIGDLNSHAIVLSNKVFTSTRRKLYSVTKMYWTSGFTVFINQWQTHVLKQMQTQLLCPSGMQPFKRSKI